MRFPDVMLAIAVLCIGVGAYMYPDAPSTIRPEFKHQLGHRAAFWHTDWFRPEAQPKIRRARFVQLTGIGIFAALMVWGWLSRAAA